MRLTTTGLAGLVGLVVKCENEKCKKSRSMLGAAGPDGLKGLTCSGSKPWLGPDEKDRCEQTDPPVVLQRGASNIYFATVASSILIPPYTSPVRKMIDVPKYWAYLTDGVAAGGMLDQVRIEELSKMQRLDVGQVRAAVEEKLREQSTEAEEQTEEDFRYAEYSALLGDKRPIADDLRIAPQKIESYDKWFRQFFDSVVLVEKLAETRALTDFSRVTPGISLTTQATRGKLSLNPTIPWLPAIRVYGEGVFVVLRREALQTWANAASARVAPLSRRYDQVTAARGRPPRGLPSSFFVLHMLAHMLIRRLSFECGYGSSSLRERIYCRESATGAMAGILIYTAAGDCEGTMGGLVRQGKPGRFESVLRSSLADAWWCSSDPLCGESSGQGTDSLNLAACHACALLPETSCEEGNRLLDRACVVGLPNSPQLGFFGEFDPTANA
jgi:hypothetical protein